MAESHAGTAAGVHRVVFPLNRSSLNVLRTVGGVHGPRHCFRLSSRHQRTASAESVSVARLGTVHPGGAMRDLGPRRSSMRVSVEEDVLPHIDHELCLATFIDILGFRALVETSPPAEIHSAVARLKRVTDPPQFEDSDEMELLHLSRTFNPTFSQSISDAVLRVSSVVPKSRPHDHGFIIGR